MDRDQFTVFVFRTVNTKDITTETCDFVFFQAAMKKYDFNFFFNRELAEEANFRLPVFGI